MVESLYFAAVIFLLIIVKIYLSKFDEKEPKENDKLIYSSDDYAVDKMGVKQTGPFNFFVIILLLVFIVLQIVIE